VKFTCAQHPNLRVHDLGVQFVNGEAEVDAKTAAELRKLPDHLGVVEVKTAGGGKGSGSAKDTPAKE
jgi:hypothetical protein